MEKITDKLAALPEDGTYFSLEFFPPKTTAVCLYSRLYQYEASLLTW
jgi:methylenetetrahydrofolate reductase (NADPH)